MKSAIVKRSIHIAKHKTSVSLENEFWDALKEIAETKETTANDLICEIHAARSEGNLSSAVRLFILSYYREQGGGMISAIM